MSIHVAPFDRPNLYFEVQPCNPHEKRHDCVLLGRILRYFGETPDQKHRYGNCSA